jgi:hypothetical protein
MFQSLEDMQKFSKDNVETATKSMAALTKGAQALATEAVDYSKKAYETSTATFEKLVGVKTLDKAIEIQTDYARSAYESFVAQSTKVGELITNLTKEAYKPYEGMMSKVGSTTK